MRTAASGWCGEVRVSRGAYLRATVSRMGNLSE